VDFVEICNIYVRKVIIKAAKKIFNSDKICRSYSNLNFGVTFLGTQCIYIYMVIFSTIISVQYVSAADTSRCICLEKCGY